MLIKRLWNACCYSVAGFGHAWRHQWAFRAELWLGILVLPLSLIVGQSALERLLLILCWLLLLVVELINSAIETTIDRMGLEHHPLSGQAKDLASAAVFVTCLMAALTWIVILTSRIEEFRRAIFSS
jgi:diacylglycerol kinase (ATP)